MDEKQAIGLLRHHVDTWRGKFPAAHFEAVEASIEALEKQIPTRPIIKKWSPAYCPSCKANLSELEGDGYYKHWTSKSICDCGQRLKWD